MKRTLSTLLLALGTHALALTPAEQNAFVAAAFKATNVSAAPCPPTTDTRGMTAVACGTYTGGTSTLKWAWDNAAGMDAGTALLPWWSVGGTEVALYHTRGHSRYEVTYTPKTGLVSVRWWTAPFNPAAPTPPSLSGTVQAGAAPTFSGPAVLKGPERSYFHALNGPVKRVTETLKTPHYEVQGITDFDTQGRLTSSVSREPDGRLSSLYTYTYVGNRVIESTERWGQTSPLNTDTYDYDTRGNIAAITRKSSGQITQVTRFEPTPNGLIATTYPKSGPPLDITWYLLDTQGRQIGKTVATNGKLDHAAYTYHGDRMTETVYLGSYPLSHTRTAYAERRTMVSLGKLKSTLDVYEATDSYGNPTRIQIYDEVTEFGKLKLVPNGIRQFSYEYYE
ncbi:hypothetical protein L1280_000533 [Deinococcus sp. HSC-46F16]|uniref:hypothetical protein n=1 Tax=Deinococcus sp. HSC-46F16 TaxID=2910968 RepID=UPI00209E95FF|nr:hypothetical protein [Deinococcus sp. HSC-46F16]MCP2013405.1 hypothetical protein [Deinococcus sp. HSC-46F16]